MSVRGPLCKPLHRLSGYVDDSTITVSSTIANKTSVCGVSNQNMTFCYETRAEQLIAFAIISQFEKKHNFSTAEAAITLGYVTRQSKEVCST